jgi:hypothetical protein
MNRFEHRSSDFERNRGILETLGPRVIQLKFNKKRPPKEPLLHLITCSEGLFIFPLTDQWLSMTEVSLSNNNEEFCNKKSLSFLKNSVVLRQNSLLKRRD